MTISFFLPPLAILWPSLFFSPSPSNLMTISFFSPSPNNLMTISFSLPPLTILWPSLFFSPSPNNLTTISFFFLTLSHTNKGESFNKQMELFFLKKAKYVFFSKFFPSMKFLHCLELVNNKIILISQKIFLLRLFKMATNQSVLIKYLEAEKNKPSEIYKGICKANGG